MLVQKKPGGRRYYREDRGKRGIEEGIKGDERSEEPPTFFYTDWYIQKVKND